MKTIKQSYRCNECGGLSAKWAGQCPDCGAWNTLVEDAAAAVAVKNERFANYSGEAKTAKLTGVVAEPAQRMSSGFGELDRVLGGGLVNGMVVLIGGDPGIGKSTLLLQVMVHVSVDQPVLYVTGEESIQQLALRADRLGLKADNVMVLSEPCVETVLAVARADAPSVMVVDSIQTCFSSVLQSAPGSVSQVRECAAQLVRFAKQNQTVMFIVGHMTKDGAIAGPRVLEHMVDTVLSFEGDGNSMYRMIRASKNRFGSVNELGVFAMLDAGLKEVMNPSAIFLTRHDELVAGSTVLSTLEGSRPMLVEVQALVEQSHAGGTRRVCVGLDSARLPMLLAVIQRHIGISMHDSDIFVNVVGGMKVLEPGADLAVIVAMLSSVRDDPLPPDLIVFGEVGLVGEIRPVKGGLERLSEAAKLGFKRAIVAKQNVPKKPISGIQVSAVTHVKELVDWFSNHE